MKKWTKLVLGAAIAMASASASANIVVTSTRTPGTGATLGFDVVRFFAAFNSASAEAVAGASGLQSVNATLESSPGALKFKFSDFDFDLENDVDVNGATIPDPIARANNSNNIGTMVRVVPAGSFSNASVAPTGSRSDPDGDGTPNSSPSQTFANVKSFRVEGFQKNPPDGPGFDPAAKTDSAIPGSGALFAVAVVPTGSAVHAIGELSADKGSLNAFDVTSGIPEPTSLAVLGLAGTALLGRRRRTA
jgi:hypothetical protein